MASIQSILNKISDLALRTGKFSIQKGEFFDLMTDMTNKVKEVNDNTNSVAKSLLWQGEVDTFNNLVTTFPNPLPCWAAMVKDEGLIYGYNGALPWKSTGLTAFPKEVALKNSRTSMNLTTEIPLETGFYTTITAREAVPVDVRMLGLILTYQLVSGFWVKEQFTGKRLDVWTNPFNWKDISKDDGLNDNVSFSGDDTFEIVDSNNNSILKVNQNGLRTSDLYPKFSSEFKITDRRGNMILNANDAGVDFIGKDDNSTVSVLIDNGKYPSDIIMSLIYGQSLSVRGSIGADTPFYNSLMFQNGVAIDYSDVNTPTTVNAYYGADFIPVNKSGVSTPDKYLMKKWMECLRDENGIDPDTFEFQICGAVPGAGGLSFDQLNDKSGIYYTRLLQAVTKAKLFATNANKTFSVGVLGWMQGEATQDMVKTKEQYYANLESIFTSLNTDIKAITGQIKDVQFITYQLASNTAPTQQSGTYKATDGVPLALLQIAIDKPNVHLGPVLYYMDPAASDDFVHQSNNSVQLQGAMFGIQSKRVINDASPILPIMPTSSNIINLGDRYLLELNFQVPVKPLVFDVSASELQNARGAQPNMGFSILNGSGIEIISSVSLKRGETVAIVCTENPTELFLYYAKTGIMGGGNLRDSQGDTIKVKIEGVDFRCDNWAPMFKITI